VVGVGIDKAYFVSTDVKSFCKFCVCVQAEVYVPEWLPEIDSKVSVNIV
jgi:hypothetical protein